MYQSIMQLIWKFLSPKFQGAEEMMSHAMEMGKSQQSIVAVMDGLSQLGKSKGYELPPDKVHLWDSFKSKKPDEIIPHAKSLLKETGFLAPVLKFFGGVDNG